MESLGAALCLLAIALCLLAIALCTFTAHPVNLRCNFTAHPVNLTLGLDSTKPGRARLLHSILGTRVPARCMGCESRGVSVVLERASLASGLPGQWTDASVSVT